jgi:hypothetical protein
MKKNRTEVKGLRTECFDFSQSSVLSTQSLKTINLQLRNLNLSYKSLILLIILLTLAVDKAVDKLWISCGWTCG